MVDFTKLMNRTPEERERDFQESAAAYEAKMRELLESRLEAIRSVNTEAKLALMSDNEAAFVRDMARLGEAHDPISKSVGGRLTYLSSPQVTYLERICQRYREVPAPESRAARFRSYGA